MMEQDEYEVALKEKILTGKEIESVRRYRVEYGSKWRNPLRKKIGEGKYGRRRYADLIGEDIDGDFWGE